MSIKESERLKILTKVTDRQLTQLAASKLLNISLRQVKRLCKQLKIEGTKGILSKKRGKRSNRRFDDEFRKKVKETVFHPSYEGYGPTLMQETLNERHGINVSDEWLRRFMSQEGLWKIKETKNRVIHQIRARRAREGELIQIDGSYHAWFEDRGPKCCLLVFIDDATSKIGELRFVNHESTDAYFEATKNYINRYGLPCALYSDRHSVFRVNGESEHRGETQFHRALKQLNIELIYARTPQAKGRVERANGILQDRLVKKLRLEGISTIEEGNKYLETFRNEYNTKFSKKPQSEEHVHREVSANMDLDMVLTRQEKRKLSKTLSLQFENKTFIIKTTNARRLQGAEITIICLPNGKRKLIFRDEELQYSLSTFEPLQSEIMDRKYITAFLDRKRPISGIDRHRRKIGCIN